MIVCVAGGVVAKEVFGIGMIMQKYHIFPYPLSRLTLTRVWNGMAKWNQGKFFTTKNSNK